MRARIIKKIKKKKKRLSEKKGKEVRKGRGNVVPFDKSPTN